MEETKGYEITGTGARVFTADGESCADVFGKLRDALREAGVKDIYTAGLSMDIGYTGFEGGGFNGTLTVLG